MLPFWRCRALRSVGECVYCLVRTSRIRWTLERLSLCASVRCEGSASFLLSGVFVKIQRFGKYMMALHRHVKVHSDV